MLFPWQRVIRFGWKYSLQPQHDAIEPFDAYCILKGLSVANRDGNGYDDLQIHRFMRVQEYKDQSQRWIEGRYEQGPSQCRWHLKNRPENPGKCKILGDTFYSLIAVHFLGSDTLCNARLEIRRATNLSDEICDLTECNEEQGLNPGGFITYGVEKEPSVVFDFIFEAVEMKSTSRPARRHVERDDGTRIRRKTGGPRGRPRKIHEPPATEKSSNHLLSDGIQMDENFLHYPAPPDTIDLCTGPTTPSIQAPRDPESTDVAPPDVPSQDIGQKLKRLRELTRREEELQRQLDKSLSAKEESVQGLENAMSKYC
ncbi:hypothetical protein BJ165DRAFT_1560188 [Panaeolus papilionaceus]|nr:hypothetical protein BJ165DRAFT_1560188 [Panaeolus papilionaceus]